MPRMEPFKFGFGESVQVDNPFADTSQPVVSVASQPLQSLQSVIGCQVRLHHSASNACTNMSTMVLSTFPEQRIHSFVPQENAEYTAECFTSGDSSAPELILYKVQIDSADAASKLGVADVNVSDLVSGIYEGGFKLWEGARDLTNVVCEQWHWAAGAKQGEEGAPGRQLLPDSLEGKRVLELGCGHGLPGIACLLAGAEVLFHVSSADFRTYHVYSCEDT
jgi:hypothetical protein